MASSDDVESVPKSRKLSSRITDEPDDIIDADALLPIPKHQQVVKHPRSEAPVDDADDKKAKKAKEKKRAKKIAKKKKRARNAKEMSNVYVLKGVGVQTQENDDGTVVVNDFRDMDPITAAIIRQNCCKTEDFGVAKTTTSRNRKIVYNYF